MMCVTSSLMLGSNWLCLMVVMTQLMQQPLMTHLMQQPLLLF